MTSPSWKFCLRKSPKTCLAASGGVFRSPRATTGSWSTVRSPLKMVSLREPYPASSCEMAAADQTAFNLRLSLSPREACPRAGGERGSRAGSDSAGRWGGRFRAHDEKWSVRARSGLKSEGFRRGPDPRRRRGHQVKDVNRRFSAPPPESDQLNVRLFRQ